VTLSCTLVCRWVLFVRGTQRPHACTNVRAHTRTGFCACRLLRMLGWRVPLALHVDASLYISVYVLVIYQQ